MDVYLLTLALTELVTLPVLARPAPLCCRS